MTLVFVSLKYGLRLIACLFSFTVFYPCSDTFLSIRAVPKSALSWINSTFTVIPNFFRFSFRPLGIVPKAPIFNLPEPCNFPCQFLIFVHLLLFLFVDSCVSRTTMSIMSALLFSVYNYNVWSSVFDYVVGLIFTSHSILTFSLSITGSAVCWYHCCEQCTLYLLQRLQCTAPATLSCLLLYSSWASLLHSLEMCDVISSLVLHILHIASPSCLSILTMIPLVCRTWSCAVMRNPLVSFFKLPVVHHDHFFASAFSKWKQCLEVILPRNFSCAGPRELQNMSNDFLAGRRKSRLNGALISLDFVSSVSLLFFCISFCVIILLQFHLGSIVPVKWLATKIVPKMTIMCWVGC